MQASACIVLDKMSVSRIYHQSTGGLDIHVHDFGCVHWQSHFNMQTFCNTRLRILIHGRIFCDPSSATDQLRETSPSLSIVLKLENIYSRRNPRPQPQPLPPLPTSPLKIRPKRRTAQDLSIEHDKCPSAIRACLDVGCPSLASCKPRAYPCEHLCAYLGAPVS